MSIRISFNDLHGLDVPMPALVRVRDVDDGVDVGVGLLDDLRKVLDAHLRVTEVDLLHSDGHTGRVHPLGSKCVGHPSVSRLD